MRNSKFLINRIICFIIALFMCAIPFMPKFANNNTSIAASIMPENNSRTVATRSTFIHSPTFSVIYHEDVFFFDEYDSKIKKYNLNDSILIEETLSIDTLGSIIDVVYIGEYVFALSKTTEEQTDVLKITLFDLTDFSIEKTITLESINILYKNIAICEIDNNYLISLTPAVNERSLLPSV